jgi:hypothetical protein
MTAAPIPIPTPGQPHLPACTTAPGQPHLGRAA